MKKSEISFDDIPASAISLTKLTICLKCAFEFFTKQLNLSNRTAYVELKKHVPEEHDFTGASTARPHFFADEATTHCPYCKGPKRWFASFTAIRVDAHPSFEKQRKKLWASLRQDKEGYTLWTVQRTQMQIFSEWLERLKRNTNPQGDSWLLDAAMAQIKRSHPTVQWDEVLKEGLRRVQLSRQIETDWRYEKGWLYVSPVLYGDALIVQHLLSRSHMHGGITFEGRLTLQELVHRLRRGDYLQARGIEAADPYDAFEQVVAVMVASGPSGVYYAVDRREFLAKLRTVYEKRRDK